MFTETDLRTNPVLVKAFTGLPSDAFFDLLDRIEAEWPDYDRERKQRDDRQRAVGGGRPYGQSLCIRLALVLTYLRLHVSQQVTALLFGASQSDVSRELRRLLPLIERVTPSADLWHALEPDLTLEELEELEMLGDGRLLIDATEQPVERSQDPAERKAHYSGKQKCFTLKTQLVTDDAHHIIAISTSVPGSMHDKKLADEVATTARLPEGTELIGDSGYQGLGKEVSYEAPDLDTIAPIGAEDATTNDASEGTAADPIANSGGPPELSLEVSPEISVTTPTKKPKGKALSPRAREVNGRIARIRMGVEHCIGWLKNWGILRQRFRCDHAIYTSVMNVICGLVNEQTLRWQEAQACFE